MFVQHGILGIRKSAERRYDILGAMTSGIYDLYMTHGDIKLDQDYAEDQIHRAQNEIGSERVEG